jgi:hypothetical protein
MKKKLISTIAMLLLVSIIAAPVVSASSQASLYLTSYSAYIYPSGNGNMSIYFNVVGTGTMDEIGALTISLQQEPSGSSTWTTVKTYSYTTYTNMLAYNNFSYGSSVAYSGVSGYSYRAYVTVWAGLDGGGDSRQILTSTVVA